MYPMIETHHLISVRSSATVDEAARLMDDCGLGALGVLDADKKFAGIFTERDLTHLVATAKNPQEIRMAEVLNDFPVVVDGPITFAEAAEQMENSHVRHLVVLEDGDHRIISMRDLIGAGSGEIVDSPSSNGSKSGAESLAYLASFAGPLPMRTSDIMSSPAVTVPAHARLEEVASILAYHDITGCPVVDGDELVGVISERDVARALGNSSVRLAIRPSGPSSDPPRDALDGHIASDVMTRPATTVSPDTPVTTAAEIMFKQHIKRLPVVIANRLQGVVTRGDVLRAFAGLSDERPVGSRPYSGG